MTQPERKSFSQGQSSLPGEDHGRACLARPHLTSGAVLASRIRTSVSGTSCFPTFLFFLSQIIFGFHIRDVSLDLGPTKLTGMPTGQHASIISSSSSGGVECWTSVRGREKKENEPVTAAIRKAFSETRRCSSDRVVSQYVAPCLPAGLLSM
ncbi:hypothetical protein B0T24DRAFT_612358 [Lasiosphaeria ovina]|uniref:Uncharacterized protein n=1 Tax=Lasiosphaeria ovina TaxID=92902 RepID=A0AAE0TS63_9PEZI|nr:hypothetical protein B0T24DRAFT_612358 [Lasiosphaeria ovina]